MRAATQRYIYRSRFRGPAGMILSLAQGNTEYSREEKRPREKHQSAPFADRQLATVNAALIARDFDGRKTIAPFV